MTKLLGFTGKKICRFIDSPNKTPEASKAQSGLWIREFPGTCQVLARHKVLLISLSGFEHQLDLNLFLLSKDIFVLKEGELLIRC